MEKITLKFNEVLALAFELNGFTDPKTNEVKLKGVLNERISLVTKYWLTVLANDLQKIKENVDRLREELIKKHGKEGENGEVFIPLYLDEDVKKTQDAEGSAGAAEGAPAPEDVPRKVNPAFEHFQKEYMELLQQEKEIEYRPILVDDLKNVETESYYPLFMKLVKSA